MKCIKCSQEVKAQEIEGFILYDCPYCEVSVFDVQTNG
jgi:DNA-directed RNA polymerase subunit RPC12/RpoP